MNMILTIKSITIIVMLLYYSYFYNYKIIKVAIISNIQKNAGFGNKMAGISSALAFSIISNKIMYCILYL